jgi:hypothetical protein
MFNIRVSLDLIFQTSLELPILVSILPQGCSNLQIDWDMLQTSNLNSTMSSVIKEQITSSTSQDTLDLSSCALPYPPNLLLDNVLAVLK